MGELVAVKIKSQNKTVTISRAAAERFAKADPKEYELISPPKIEVLKLEPLPEKKSVAAAPNELKVEPVKEEVKSKMGRPKKV